MPTLSYARVLLKLSGEALTSPGDKGVDLAILQKVVSDIAEVKALGAEVAIVLGGGNFLRGESSQTGFDRVTADQMGMLATVMNGLALRMALQQANVGVQLFSTTSISGVVDIYDRTKALSALESGEIVICAAGTGLPYVSTDSAAAIRAAELNADIILKASTIDGVYSADPKKVSDATRYEQLDYDTVIQKKLRVMDLTAICLCQENNIPVRVFDMNKPDVLKNILLGASEGTLIS